MITSEFSFISQLRAHVAKNMEKYNKMMEEKNMSMMYDKTPDDFDWSFTSKPAMPSKTKAIFNDEEFMKNKDRISELEKQVQVLANRVAILEMKANPKVPASAPVEWPTWKQHWINGPQEYSPKPYRIIPMMDAQCKYHH